ncbi:B-cadherin-like [Coregonus clupeaformis]|uniref:B-cadherin-like n=1 Tax=Coregonus clupeaformis TaxID=59861 RepID=UPI001E1C6575|nr:B-cadherin-like [Coregonus clupeaformis]
MRESCLQPQKATSPALPLRPLRSLSVPALGDPPDVPVEDPPDVPVEDPPDVPVEDPPDVPVEDAPDVPMEDPPDVPVEDPPEVPVEDPPDVPVEDPPHRGVQYPVVEGFGHEDAGIVSQPKYPASLPVLEFPKSLVGLVRRKRDWIIPPINFPENDRGPFPKSMVQIRSSNDKEVKIQYSITGPGADQPPVGLFTVDKNSGVLYVTKPLDRERQDQYILVAHADTVGSGTAEEPMEIIVKVIDMNDNKPVFTQDPFTGIVPEAYLPGFEVMEVTATDADERGSANSDVRYTIISQEPELPSPNMFVINPVTGWIGVNAAGLDREKIPKYTLEIQAADMEGNGLTSFGKSIITVTDVNDIAPQFVMSSNTVSVPENKVNALVVKMPVIDGDEPHSSSWATVYRIVDGDPGGLFTVNTEPNRLEGIITTAKPLDFEKNNRYTLLVTVENEVPFAIRLPTSTATVQVNVEDLNDAPVFDPVEKVVSISEHLPVDSDLVLYTAIDPDIMAHKLMYRMYRDPAKWLDINSETGMIKTKHPLDRESPFVKDGKYRVLILAIESDEIPATATGTILIELEDVNDNAPTIDDTPLKLCNQDPRLVRLAVTDRDGPDFAEPFSVELLKGSKMYCTAQMDKTGTVVELTFKAMREQRNFYIDLTVTDAGGLNQDHVIHVTMNEDRCMTWGDFCVRP